MDFASGIQYGYLSFGNPLLSVNQVDISRLLSPRQTRHGWTGGSAGTSVADMVIDVILRQWVQPECCYGSVFVEAP